MPFNYFRVLARNFAQVRRLHPRATAAAFTALILLVVYVTVFAAPLSFPSGTYVKVAKGETLSQVAAALEEKHAVRSASMLRVLARLWGGRVPLVAGEYYFAGPENSFTVARRIAHGDFRVIPVRITFTEGMSSMEMANVLDQKLKDFDKDQFEAQARPREGYLFPDTYFFTPGEDPDQIIAELESTFTQKMGSTTLQQAIVAFRKPLPQVITMASLVEKEASNMTDRRIIAGILWHRIALGMPLQVDAVFPYIIGVSSLQLTTADLKTDSPYNTYTNKGLPPGPIGNPGLDAILATVTPIQTPYLYYLSDASGKFHYSATYAGQLANRRKYLGK